MDATKPHITPLRLFLVIDETPFYHPPFVHDLIQLLPGAFCGVAVVTRIPPKNNIQKYLSKQLAQLTLREFLTLGFRTVWAKFRSFVGWKPGRTPYSVQQVLAHYQIPYIQVENNINLPLYLEFIRNAQPDVLISSNSLIFKKELLQIPRLGCINRHSGLLPAFGGLWPVFQAVAQGDTETGVTIHTMELKIDKGQVLAQQRIPLGNKPNLSALYKQCFELSAPLLVQSIQKLEQGTFTPIQNGKTPSYYSFPTPQDWKAFRINGGRWV